MAAQKAVSSFGVHVIDCIEAAKVYPTTHSLSKKIVNRKSAGVRACLAASRCKPSTQDLGNSRSKILSQRPRDKKSHEKSSRNAPLLALQEGVMPPDLQLQLGPGHGGLQRQGHEPFCFGPPGPLKLQPAGAQDVVATVPCREAVGAAAQQLHLELRPQEMAQLQAADAVLRRHGHGVGQQRQAAVQPGLEPRLKMGEIRKMMKNDLKLYIYIYI